jgi:hypothetical protein
MDLKGAFTQFRIHPAHQHITSFMWKGVRYEFLVAPFALTNMPNQFNEIIHMLLIDYIAPSQNAFASPFMDDIFVYSQTFEDHLDHL